mmetsp:Transcript_37221/g.83838  ORF Transcript_37221/g.83838 Transcript_37221/m.83838 type:complete len:365 (-) Transcript_37221:27-1121(-)
MNAPAYSTAMMSPAELQAFEQPLMAMANLSKGDLRKLFYALFSFLNRRTDFYCIHDKSDGPNMGFVEGQAEKILLASFRQFPLRKVGKKPRGVVGAPPVSKKSTTTRNEAAVKQSTGKPAGESSTLSSSNTKSIDQDVRVDAPPAPEQKGPEKVDSGRSVRLTEDGKQIPVGNGGSTNRYVWVQTLEEVTVHVPLPEGTRGKDLDVKISAGKLSVKSKEGTKISFEPIEGTLYAKVRPSESTWTLETTTHSSQQVTTLQLILEKVQKTWWSIILNGDTPQIDTSLVDSTRYIDTYNNETQAEIRRILFDQRQERLGLPTSAQILDKEMEVPPLPNSEDGGSKNLPSGVEFIDQETLQRASIGGK